MSQHKTHKEITFLFSQGFYHMGDFLLVITTHRILLFINFTCYLIDLLHFAGYRNYLPKISYLPTFTWLRPYWSVSWENCQHCHCQLYHSSPESYTKLSCRNKSEQKLGLLSNGYSRVKFTLNNSSWCFTYTSCVLGYVYKLF